MSRAPRKTALTSSANPQLERQARRISRQQKQLAKELNNENAPVKLTGATGRGIRKSDLKKIQPLTDAQENFFDSYEDGEENFVLYGSAGTGKSYLALFHALSDILEPDTTFEKIIIIRSCVQSRAMGFLPGTEDEKFLPYELPYHSICAELLGRPDAYDKLKDLGKIEFMSTSFLRGLSFNNAIIILDEGQNTTFTECSTVISRKGMNSKLIILGDIKQDDLVQNKNDVSGFRDIINVAQNMTEFTMIRFTSEDICRSPFVKSWIINCEKLGL